MDMSLDRFFRIYRREGAVGFIKLFFIRSKKIAYQILLIPIVLPITILIIVINPWIHIRLIRLHSNRVGHYAFNTEVFLCVMDNYHNKDNKIYKTLFYTVPGRPISNKQLHRMWKRVITIMPFPSLIEEINRYLIKLNQFKNEPLKKYFEEDDGIDKWAITVKEKKSHINFTDREIIKGKKLLEQLGVPKGAQFICLLSRDNAYLKKQMPKADFSYHELRNVDIDDFKLAAQYLADKGYYVIRMGKYVEKPFNINHSNMIDYANHPLRSDFMDVYLSAHCLFYLSVGSGIDGIAQVFRKPIIVTNQPMIVHCAFADWSIITSKKIYDTKRKKHLTFMEIYNEFYHVSAREWQKLADEKGYQFIENTPEEIKDVTEEMLKKVTQQWEYSKEEDALHRQFWYNFPKYFSNDGLALKYSVFKYQNMMEEGKLRVGNNFLKQLEWR